MKYNADLTQAQDQVGSLGQGITTLSSSSVGGQWQGATVIDNAFVSAPDLGTISSVDGKYMSADTVYKYGFIDRIFSRKRNPGDNKAYFNHFFSVDGSSRQCLAFEVPSAGQVQDLLLRRDVGIIDYHLGDMRPGRNNDESLYSIFDSSRYVDGVTGVFAKPTSGEWLSKNFRDKLISIFNKLFSANGSTAGFVVHGSSFVGGSIIVGSSVTTTASFVDIHAGLSTISDSPIKDIFKVVGGNDASVAKQIMIRDQNNAISGAKHATGIAFEFCGTDYWTDYPMLLTSRQGLGFMDVPRYYLRYDNGSTSTHKTTTSSIKYMTYMDMDNQGMPRFMREPARGEVGGGAMSVTIPFMQNTGLDVRFVLNACLQDQRVLTAGHFFDFIYDTDAAAGGLALGYKHGAAVVRTHRFYVDGAGQAWFEQIGLTNSKTAIPFYNSIANTVSGKRQSLLTSYAGPAPADAEYIMSALTLNANTDQMFRQFRAGDNYVGGIGSTIYKGSHAIIAKAYPFLRCVETSASAVETVKDLKAPLLNTSSWFLVSNPGADTQTIVSPTSASGHGITVNVTDSKRDIASAKTPVVAEDADISFSNVVFSKRQLNISGSTPIFNAPYNNTGIVIAPKISELCISAFSPILDMLSLASFSTTINTSGDIVGTSSYTTWDRLLSALNVGDVIDVQNNADSKWYVVKVYSISVSTHTIGTTGWRPGATQAITLFKGAAISTREQAAAEITESSFLAGSPYELPSMYMSCLDSIRHKFNFKFKTPYVAPVVGGLATTWSNTTQHLSSAALFNARTHVCGAIVRCHSGANDYYGVISGFVSTSTIVIEQWFNTVPADGSYTCYLAAPIPLASPSMLQYQKAGNGITISGQKHILEKVVSNGLLQSPGSYVATIAKTNHGLAVGDRVLITSCSSATVFPTLPWLTTVIAVDSTDTSFNVDCNYSGTTVTATLSYMPLNMRCEASFQGSDGRTYDHNVFGLGVAASSATATTFLPYRPLNASASTTIEDNECWMLSLSSFTPMSRLKLEIITEGNAHAD